MISTQVACSLGNAVHNLWPNVDAAHVPRDWLSADLSEAEVSRGGASLCDALMAMRGVGGRVEINHWNALASKSFKPL